METATAPEAAAPESNDKVAPAKPKVRKAPAKKPARAAAKKSAKPAKERGMGLLEAGYRVLKGTTKPMTIGDIYQKIIDRKLWKPGKGKTPQATLSAAVIGDIAKGPRKARFKRVDCGLFTTTAN